MAKHRMAREHWARNTILAGAAAVVLSGALVLGHAANTTAANVMVQLTKTVIGAGGQGDPTGFRVPAKLSDTVVPDGYDYAPVNYPATINLAASRDIGVPVLRAILTDHIGEDYVIVTGYSEGTLVAEKVRGPLQALEPDLAPSPDNLAFLFIASPFAPNGGIYNRFPGLAIPGVIDSFGPATPTRYDTTYVAMEYDPYADFPAYFNPLALANAALGVRYAHPDQYYDAIRPGVTPAYVTPVVNSAGGTDTYVLVYNQHLPLLGVFRELSALTATSSLTEPLLGAIEPLLRVLVDMGYTDRANTKVATPTPFSFVTSPAKIVEALGALPGALGQGNANLLSGGQAASVPPPAPNLSTVPVSDAPAPAPVLRQARVAPAPTQAPKPLESAVQPTAPSGPPATPVATPGPRGDGLHPTVISDGNKVTPGETPAAGSPTSDATTTTATPSTATNSDTTPGSPAEHPTADGEAAA